ncbi:MAG: hypothetical protein ACJAVI_001117 [Candidatus Azotimanducaceae bacterium]
MSGISALPEFDLLVFLDADFCDNPKMIFNMCEPIAKGSAEFFLGSRMHGVSQKCLTPPQRFGNWLAARLMNLIWQTHYTDLGPFRAIRRTSLDQLNMLDTNFGWTVEMQIKAAQAGLKITEIEVPYRHRDYGQSKVSGTVSGVWHAGTKILYVIFREFWAQRFSS